MRGERLTWLINTGDELPEIQAARRISRAAHQEVAEQLERMQRTGVTRPSSGPWSGTIVFMRKRDKTPHF